MISCGFRASKRIRDPDPNLRKPLAEKMGVRLFCKTFSCTQLLILQSLQYLWLDPHATQGFGLLWLRPVKAAHHLFKFLVLIPAADVNSARPAI
jgi:hypothetical protein